MNPKSHEMYSQVIQASTRHNPAKPNPELIFISHTSIPSQCNRTNSTTRFPPESGNPDTHLFTSALAMREELNEMYAQVSPR
ncbi:MAG: hypothetical protein RQ826_11900 [Xanthomonadales bacterium]|nr:hypothetical protein [Xanthomonadales bacterium]